MQSSQINFYMMPEDIAELEQYIKEQGLIMISETSMANKPQVLDSLNINNGLFVYLVLPENLKKIKIEYIEEQKKYFVISIQSPIIEYCKSVIIPEKKIKNEGRIYFDKFFYNDLGEAIEKDLNTIQISKNIFSWLKKYLKKRDAKKTIQNTTN